MLNNEDHDLLQAQFDQSKPNHWYFAKVCPHYPCFNVAQDVSLLGNSYTEVLPVNTKEECMEACLTRRLCRSINYHKTSKLCYIFHIIRSFFPSNTLFDDFVIYFEKKPECLVNCDLQKLPNNYLDVNHVDVYNEVQTDIECLELCYKNPRGCRYTGI